ncbi:putative DNA binding domain-containing protein [Pseudomonas cichorii]|nr:RNA-binding domain-containing protein [Pseudomonas cichorii]MBX8508518.1 putative DNA binding domain-containing protein [Pseudomonas cichorii]MBX8523822.1 putative DNA binding domain-containing protein [Pseudomonas cichorii]
MATESEVSIGGTYLGGTAKRVGDLQAMLFNASDLVAVGGIADDSFFRAYQITVRELRRRLEAFGYSLTHVREQIVSTLQKGYGELSDDDIPQCKSFLDYGCKITVEQLIELARHWRNNDNKNYNYMAQFDLNNYPSTMLDFIQGCSSEFLLPSQNIWVRGYHFERLLCEVYSDEEVFKIDFTRLVKAGYYKPDDQPIINEFDRLLSQFNPLSFRLMEKIKEEESETLEFKALVSGNPTKSIGQQLPKYLIGFLNGKGGRILFGVTDAGIVEGVTLNREERDQLQRNIGAAVSSITPNFPQAAVEINLRPLISIGAEMEDKFVIDISVPSGKSNEMYFTHSGETWVRHGTSTFALKGHQLFVHICTRYSSADDLLRVVRQRAHTAMEEIRRLERAGERSEVELANKQGELLALRESVSSAWQLLKETDLICPMCESPLAIRHSFSDSISIGGKDIDVDLEYIQYECGYATRDDRDQPVSLCSKQSQVPTK